MEGNKNKSRALLIFGAPCSGKTTFCEKFAKKFGLAYYNLDDLRLNDGFSRSQIMTLLALIMRTGQTIVVEGGLSTEKERKEVRELVRRCGYEPSLIWIQTDAATIRARLKAKFKNVAKAKEIYDAAINQIEAPTETEKPIILSGKHTFETQTRHVVTGLADLSEAR